MHRTASRTVLPSLGSRATRAALLALALVSAAVSPALGAPDGVRLLATGPASVRFVVEVPEVRLEAAGPGLESVRLAVDGYESLGPPGRPLLPERVVSVAVPPLGEVRVSAGAGGYRTLEAVRLLRAPDMPRHRELAEGEALARTEALAALGEPAGAWPGPEPGVRARLLEVGWMRNQRIARIAVTPADYDVAAGRLSVAGTVEIEVSVAGSSGVAGDAAPVPAAGSDPFEAVYYETLVNYEQGRSWRRAGRVVTGPDPFRPGGSPLRAAAGVPDTSVYAGREWIKIAVDTTGFYRVTFAQLRTLSLFGGRETTPLDSLRLFTWPGFPVLPENSYCDSCDYREVAMGFVEVTDNDTLDKNQEYLYFYAHGPSDWASLYDPVLPDTVFINHPYETTNYYYLTIASASLPVGGTPRRIATESGDPGGATGGEVTPATFEARAHLELDTPEYWPDNYPNPFPFRSNLFWEKWFWRTLKAGDPPFTVTADAPGVDASQPSRLRARLWGVTELSFRSSGIRDHYLDVDFNGVSFPRRSWDRRWAQTYDTTLVGLVQPTNALTLRVPVVTDPNPDFNAERVDWTALAWFDLFYARRFEPVANALDFDSPQGGGAYLYDIGPFTLDPVADLPPRVFDVTDPLAPVEILGASYTDAGGGFYRLRFHRVESQARRYRVLPDARVRSVANAQVFMAPSSSLGNLRSSPSPDVSGADYLIIYYDGFQAAADSLAAWRQARLPLHGVLPPYRTAAVPISAVYDQFSGGRTDPGAIRNFLRAAYFNWADPPGFVTLFGDASSDFKDIKGLAPPGLPGTPLPAYEGGFDFIVRRQFATDDWMLNVDDPVTVIPDFFGGRIPAGDASEALAFVRDKLLPYERSAPLQEWRNRVMLIADDHEQGARVDQLRWEHLRQTAVLDRTMPNHVDRVYVYLHTYPDGPGETKPLAKADIVEAINGEGVVMWNFVGHGSPFKISDESVFLDSDAGILTNLVRPSLFVAASCDVGKFNDPSVQSLGERLIMSANGGCVAVISATELAFSYQNAELNRVLYDFIFRRDSIQTSPTHGRFFIGLPEALLVSKTGSTNNQKYQVMGDAGTSLALPRLWADLTLTDAAGVPIDTLPRGGTVHFEGRILDRPGGTLVPFTGSTAVLIEDSAPVDTTFACSSCRREPYPFRAAPMFRGDARVTGGTFRGSFVVPLDAILGSRARLRGYASGAAAGTASAIDAVGSLPFTLVAGTPPAGDAEGPQIGLSFLGGSNAVRPDAVLRIDLFDESGILITGHTIQNGIIVTVDDNSNTRVDVTSSFRYAANSHQAGTASFQLPGLAPGPHSIRVSAADNLASGINAAQHRSSATIEFEVSENPPLSIRRAFLFPNPTRSGGPGGGGQFVIDAPGDSVNVLLHIYTVSGRLIRTLKSFGGRGQVQIPWDGLDAEGDRLALGTYLFMVQVNAREADGGSSPRSRAVAEGRLVVVGR